MHVDDFLNDERLPWRFAKIPQHGREAICSRREGLLQSDLKD